MQPQYFTTLLKYWSKVKYASSMTWQSRTESALQSVLPGPLRVSAIKGPARDLDVMIAGAKLRVRWLPVGWPREVEDAARTDPRPDIVIAPKMSPGAQKAAKDKGIGWIDETGAARIVIADPLIVIEKDGDPREPLNTKVGWRRSTLAVCEAILAEIADPTVNSVVSATGISIGSAAAALKFLEQDGHLEGSVARGPDAARRIADRDLLLDAYSTAAARLRIPTSIEVGVLWRDPIPNLIAVGSSWNAAGFEWAMTSALSASLLAPFMTEVAPMEVYVTGRTPTDLHRAAQAVGLSAIVGGRLILRPFPTPAGARVSFEIAPGASSALWPRAFADLRVAGVRGDDAAEHLREVMTT